MRSILTTTRKDKRQVVSTPLYFFLLAVAGALFVITVNISFQYDIDDYASLPTITTTYQAAYAAAAPPGDWTGLLINGTLNPTVSRYEAHCKFYSGNKALGNEDGRGLPRSVATNSTGHIFVLYEDIYCVDIYSPDGKTHLKSFGDFGWVYSGYYFNSAGKYGHLMQYCQPNWHYYPTPTGDPPSKVEKAATCDGEFAWPRDIAIDKHDRVIIADTLNSRIQVFDSNGDYLFKFGHHHKFSKPTIKNGFRTLLAPNLSTHDGQFTSPASVAVDNKLERIIVANGVGNANTYGYDKPLTYNIQIYDFDGNFIDKFGQYGQVYCPGNENDPDGDLICRTPDHHDQFWDEKFQYQFNNPWVVAVHPIDSRIFVGDMENERIQVYTSEGVYLDTIAGIPDSCQDANFWSDITGMAFDSHGRLYLAESYNSRIMVIDYPYGTAPETINGNFDTYGTGGDNPTYPELLYEIRGDSSYSHDRDGTTLYSDSIGNVYVGDRMLRPEKLTVDTSAYGKDRIIVPNRYDSSVIGLEAIPVSFPNTNSFDPDSILSCKLYGRSGVDYSVADEWETWGVTGTVDFPEKLNYLPNPHYAWDGKEGNPPTDFNVTEPLAIAFNSTGHMFVTTEEEFLSKLLVFDSDLKHTGTFGGDKGGEVPQPYPYPSWNNNKYAYYDPPKIVINSTDHVFVSGKGKKAVTVYEPDMKYSSMVYQAQVNGPLWGVAVDDANDRMYVADTQYGLIRVYDHQESDMWQNEADTLLCFPDPNIDPTAPGAVAARCLKQTDLVGGDGIPPDNSNDAGSEYGMFAGPLYNANFLLGMAVHPDDGRLIVADTGNDRIQIFDKDGDLVNAIGAVGDSPIEYPLDVIVDPHNGNILFTDRDPKTENSRIVVLDSDAEPLGIISNLSNSTGHAFEQVTQIAVHPITGQIYAVSHAPPTDKTYTKSEHPHAVIMIGPESSSSSSSSKKGGGGGSDFDYINAPTFGLSHDTRSSASRLIDSGISLNGLALDVGSFHTEFAKQILQTGQDNTLSTKVKASTGYGGLKIIEFFYGVPRIGALSQAEGSIEVHLNPYDRSELPEITDIAIRDNKHSLLSQGNTTATVQRVDCIKGDAKKGCYKVDIGFVFANSPVGEVFALQATDSRGWSTTEYFNDGFEVQGAPLAPVTMSIAADLARGAGKGSTEVTQIDRKNDLWLSTADNTTLYTKNDFGFWKKLTPDKPLNRCSQDTEYDTKEWNVMTRMHCQYDKQIESEAKMAQNVFNSSAIQKELPPESFAHEPPLAIDHRSALLHKLGWITTDDVVKRIELSGKYDHIDGQQLKSEVHQLLLLGAADAPNADTGVTAIINKINSEVYFLKEQFNSQSSILAQIHSTLEGLSHDLTQQKQKLDSYQSTMDSYQSTMDSYQSTMDSYQSKMDDALQSDNRNNANENEFFAAMSQYSMLLYVLPLIVSVLIAVLCLFYFRRYTKTKAVAIVPTTTKETQQQPQQPPQQQPQQPPQQQPQPPQQQPQQPPQQQPQQPPQQQPQQPPQQPPQQQPPQQQPQQPPQQQPPQQQPQQPPQQQPPQQQPQQPPRQQPPRQQPPRQPQPPRQQNTPADLSNNAEIHKKIDELLNQTKKKIMQ